MKIDRDLIQTLGMIMESLSNGVDPISGVGFPNDTVLNSRLLKKAFAETAEVMLHLASFADPGDIVVLKNGVNRKLPFFMTAEEYSQLEIGSMPVSISHFTFQINSIVRREKMKMLRATQFTQWLNENGYLEVVVLENGNEYKKATALGNNTGIYSIEKVNSRGERYVTNMYSSEAQEFLINEVLPSICRITK